MSLKSSRIVKASPSKKRIIPATLSAFYHFDLHVDIIGLCYEYVTEEKEEDIDLNDFELLGDDLYKLTTSVEVQLGIDKYVEMLLFIKSLKKKYVTDWRETTYNIATKRTLVEFDEDGKNKIINYKFDAVLIYKEMEKFVVNPKVLKMLSKEFLKNRGKL